ncbi:MAG: peptide-methionine (S)-S-oxide reductase [Pelagibacteraceae bacterium TMED287]|nr:MAG: peptide-methionine (S)-S-oxide reductase [Pelagibacteraceae bacterium TMED287]|tara:strand:- start:236 stop:688 length:453 start_codon:yes stop_codon:yes gene_type:complete
MQKIYFGMGCFWKPEEQFKNIKGILETEVGYAGGYKSKVTYEEVCQGNTGHAEVVKLLFDENTISFEKVLELFFKMHDPTQKNMQFPDVGKQYRSEIFYENEQQKEEALKIKEKFNKVYNNKIETNISPIKNYCKAEEYHQRYIEKKGIL